MRLHSHSRSTVEAAHLLGARIRLARSQRHMSLQELAARVGVTRKTIHKVEVGDLTVGLGVAFEAATMVGVPLFHEDRTRRRLEARHVDDRLALLPQLVRPIEVDDDF